MKNKIHIAFLTPEYPYPGLSRSGGLGTSIKNLSIELVKNGVKATVLVIGQQEDKIIDDRNVVVLSIAKRQHKAFNWYFERKRIQRIVQQYIDENQVDVIEAPDWTGLSAFMKFSIPLIIRMNGSDGYFCYLEGRKQKWKHRFLESKALKSANALLAASTFTGTVTKKLFRLKQGITTIHNSIDTSVFVPLQEPVNPLQILYFGTLVRKKGVLELPFIFNKVVEQLPEAQLVLIGKDNTDVLKQQSTWSLFQEELSPLAKDNVRHLVEVPYEKIKTHIARAQVVVLPSFAEAFPMTWLETLAMEKPLVSSNIGWARELMVDGETGYTVNPKDHDAFAFRIVELLQDQTRAKEMGVKGREKVKNQFSTTVILPKNIDFYKKIINQYAI